MSEQRHEAEQDGTDAAVHNEDPDAGPASVPTGAASEPLPSGTEDQDAGAASEPPD